MDVSVFIANKKIFWIWILAPLFVRFVLVSAVFGVTEKTLSLLEKERACVDSVKVFDAECEANAELLKQFEVDPMSPLNEQLYTLMDEKNAKFGLGMSVNVTDSSKKKKTAVVKNGLMTAGSVPSVYLASQFVADMLSDPLISLESASISSAGGRRGAAGGEVKLNCSFEKTVLYKAGGRK